MEPRVSKQRQHDLRSMSTSQLLWLVQDDWFEHNLSYWEVRFIRHLAEERSEAGDVKADELKADVDAYTN